MADNELTKSQEDREVMQQRGYSILLKFLETYVSSIAEEKTLEQALEAEILVRIEEDQKRAVEDKKIPLGQIIAALKVIKDHNASKGSSILGVLKESTKVIIENNNNTSTEKPYDLTLTEVSEIKNLKDNLVKILHTEKSIDE